MVRISIYEPAPRSAVAYYRSIGTLPYLHRLNSGIKIIKPSVISWDQLIDVDVLYLERPHTNNDITVLKLAKDFGIKIWVDFDDLFHAIPEYNPCYNNFFDQDSPFLQNTLTAIAMADTVTVSTPAIRNYYLPHNKNIHVIENAHNDYQYPFVKVENTVGTINWRGSATHRKDLESVKENIFNIAKAHPKWAWVFIGNDIWYILDEIPKERYFHAKEMDIVDFNRFIRDSKSSIQIVPLVDNLFNHGKSNIAWMEGTAAGSCTVCPSLPEFQKPGAINYSQEKPDHFGYLLEKAMKSNDFRQKNYIQSYEYIKENLLLSQVNKKRLEVIEELI